MNAEAPFFIQVSPYSVQRGHRSGSTSGKVAVRSCPIPDLSRHALSADGACRLEITAFF
jgi:hypothetical protein